MAGLAPNGEVTVERLWLNALQEIGRLTAHEVKNALNGVAVNVEVVRARAARPGAAAEAVARFADAAAEQLDALTRLNEALLAVLRPVPEPPDVGAVLGRLVTLLGAAARAEGGDVIVRRSGGDGPAHTAADGEHVRALLAALLLAAAQRGATLSCELDGAGAPAVRIVSQDGSMRDPPADVLAVAEIARVQLDCRSDAWTVVFPAAAATSAGPADSLAPLNDP